MIAREHVEIGAGDADHPSLLRVRGRMDHAGAIGLGLPRSEPIAAHRLENRVRLALGVRATPFRHFRVFPCLPTDCPRSPLALPLSGFVPFLTVPTALQ